MMTTVTEEIRKYELMVIFSGDIPESSFEKETSELRKLLKDNSKSISYEDNWGKRELAYKIKRQNRGYYIVFAFHANPAQIAEIRMNIKLNPQVLRHMLIIIPEAYDSSRYKEEMFTRKQAEDSEVENKKRLAKIRPKIEEFKSAAKMDEVKETVEKPTVAGKQEEEQLENVQKKLEAILDNPDIDIK